MKHNLFFNRATHLNQSQIIFAAYQILIKAFTTLILLSSWGYHSPTESEGDGEARRMNALEKRRIKSGEAWGINGGA